MALYSFDRYPYSNAHELNLDWLLEEMKKLGYQMDNFVLLNTIKVANPITWDVTKTYERLTIVTYSDADGYRAYLSIADVPAGIAITNTLYWAPIGTIIDSSIISDLEARITEDLQELSDDVDARLAAQKTLLEGEIADVEDKLPVLNHNRITYYIDANAGNDENDGLTEATAFKTFDRFMEQADKYQALHARIISAGNYSYSYYEIANIDLDIQATTGGVVLTFATDPTDNRFTLYNGRINIYGAEQAAVPMELRLATNGILYMLGCVTSLHDMNIVPAIRVYGGEIWLENDTLFKLYTRNSYARLYNCHISNNDPAESAIRLLNGVTLLLGNCTADALSEPGAAATALISAVGGQISITGTGFTLSQQTNYYYGLEAANCTVLVPDNISTMLVSYSINGIKYTAANVPTLTSN